MEYIKNLATICGYIMVIISLCTLIIKPLRNKFVEYIHSKAGTNEQNKEIEELKKKHDEDIKNILQRQDEGFNKINEKLDFLINENKNNKNRMELYDKIHICTLRNRIANIYYKYLEDDYIPSFEKKLLMEHYSLYKDESLKGNGYIDEMYKFLMTKKEKIIEHIEN